MDAHAIGPERGTKDVTTPPEAAATEGVRGPPPQESAPKEARATGEQPREKRVEVRYEGENWVVDHDGREEVPREHTAREKAVARARSLAHERKALLVIYDEDGTIEEQQDYGTMGVRPSPEADVTGEKGTEATAQAEQRTMHRG